tara:strand:- start:3781 stop:5313 length:1533 start_codon:yes stop_codon:yes gene_type:complete
MEWITTDTADAPSAAGSEGRARFIDFESSSVAANTTIQIRGSGSSEYPDRIYLVKNSLNGSYDLILDAGSGSDLTIKNGAYALVVVHGSAVDGSTLTAQTVLNALSNLQIDDLLFPAAADITLVAGSTAALEIKSTASNSEFLRFDTSNDHLEVAPGSGINTVEIQAATVDASSQNTKIEVRNGQATSLQISQSSEDYLTVDTNNTKIIIGESATNVDTDLASPDINITHSSGTDVNLVAGQASALGFFDGGSTEFVRLDTANGTNTGSNRIQLLADQCDLRVESGNEVQLISGSTLDVDGTSDFSAAAKFTNINVDGGTIDGTNIGVDAQGSGKFSSLQSTGTTTGLHLSAADSYASFGATAGDGGHGVSDDSGVLKVKNTNSDAWGQPYHTGMVSGQGSYFEVTQTDVSASSVTTHSTSFSAVPSIVTCYLKCTSAENGYTSGDHVLVSSTSVFDTGSTGLSVTFDGTASGDITVTIGDGGLYLLHKANANEVALDESKWDLVIKAWK